MKSLSISHNRILGIIGLSLTVWVISIFVSPSMAFSAEIITENFDTGFTSGVSINGINGWVSDTNDAYITTTQSYSSPNSVTIGVSAPSLFGKANTGNYSASDTQTFKVYIGGSSTSGSVGAVFADNYSTLNNVDSEYIKFCVTSATEYSIYTGGSVGVCTGGTALFTNVTKATWNTIKISFTGTDENFTVSLNGSVSSSEITKSINQKFLAFNSVSSGSNPVYWDDFGIVPVAYYLTQIIDFQPETSTSTPISSPVTISADYFIGDIDVNDIGESVDVYMDLYDLNTGFTVQKAVLINESYNSTTGSIYSFSTSTALVNGNYMVRLRLEPRQYYFSFKDKIEQKNYFIVGTSTPQGAYVAGISTGEIALPTPEDWSSTADLSSCNVLSGFSAKECIYGLFKPTDDDLGRVLNYAKTSLFLSFPFGYITDVVNILNSTTTVPIPLIEGTIPVGVAGSGTSFSFGINEHSFDEYLYATSSMIASSTETLYDKTSYYWNWFVWVMFGMYIFSRLIKIRK